MSLRLATFNAENLMHRFDFSGYKNERRRDRALHILEVKDKEQYKQLEQARVVAHTDDTLQLTALAIANTRADIVCLQEVENMAALEAFEYGYLYKMTGQGYRHKYLIEGNDGRGIDVAIMMRDETTTGEKIEFVSVKSHAHLTYEAAGLFNDTLKEMGVEAQDKVFRRDCLEVDVKIDGRPLTLYVVHFKSMGGGKEGGDSRLWTMPIRQVEAAAVRQIIETRFKGKTDNKNWAICGDLNDYRLRIKVTGEQHTGLGFKTHMEDVSGYDVLLKGGFAQDISTRLEEMERWTLYHSRGLEERHLCQLDYILTSPRLADRNPKAVPKIIRAGQPFRTPFPEGQEVERFPRTGWDRPKASDHCPVVLEISV